MFLFKACRFADSTLKVSEIELSSYFVHKTGFSSSSPIYAFERPTLYLSTSASECFSAPKLGENTKDKKAQ